MVEILELKKKKKNHKSLLSHNIGMHFLTTQLSTPVPYNGIIYESYK